MVVTGLVTNTWEDLGPPRSVEGCPPDMETCVSDTGSEHPPHALCDEGHEYSNMKVHDIDPMVQVLRSRKRKDYRTYRRVARQPRRSALMRTVAVSSAHGCTATPTASATSSACWSSSRPEEVARPVWVRCEIYGSGQTSPELRAILANFGQLRSSQVWPVPCLFLFLGGTRIIGTSRLRSGL